KRYPSRRRGYADPQVLPLQQSKSRRLGVTRAPALRENGASAKLEAVRKGIAKRRLRFPAACPHELEGHGRGRLPGCTVRL
ncbi:MAG TPA: hypothetical protein PLM33_11185, partial [Acidobacteriota bacterium]|nr:hypothetical protein [Acidobacteriota bacterium]